MLVCAVHAKPALRAEQEAEKPFDRSGSRPRRATLDVTLTLFHPEGKRHSGVVGGERVVTSAADKGKSGGVHPAVYTSSCLQCRAAVLAVILFSSTPASWKIFTIKLIVIFPTAPKVLDRRRKSENLSGLTQTEAEAANSTHEGRESNRSCWKVTALTTAPPANSLYQYQFRHD